MAGSWSRSLQRPHPDRKQDDQEYGERSLIECAAKLTVQGVQFQSDGELAQNC